MKQRHFVMVAVALSVCAASRGLAAESADGKEQRKDAVADPHPSALIDELDNDSFRSRENATRSLIRLGKPAIPSLSIAVTSDDPEVRYRSFLVLGTFLTSNDRELSRLAKDALRSIAKSEHRAAAMQAKRTLQGNQNATWAEFESQSLQDAIHGGKTVFVYFRADWCPQCRNIEREALMSAEFGDLVRKNKVSLMLADIADPQSREGKTSLEALKKLGSKEIPTVAIFSAAKSAQPEMLIGRLDKRRLLAALASAGPSKTAAEEE